MASLRKMDEMERKFTDQTVKIGYTMMFLMLFTSAIFQRIKTGQWNFDFFVVVVVSVVQSACYQWFKYRVDRTDKEPSRFLYITIAIVSIIFTIGLIALMF
ncbi:DUF6442 family protein [Lacticaseibacillus chiayiensis]|uniref:DUF6442 family protein n=1 Tax=Lacticaseibacillus chiayiensis TaxID=2100821 RepID=A0ABY6H7Z9_9LACO|nr:DUF6442 family protein [Lacticaseibacillus chiayiensis]UYN57326.1 DUF6442 family protein [Lacticaseibacillus chiayiensis]